MKITINPECVKQHGLSQEEIFLMLAISKQGRFDYEKVLQSLIDKGYAQAPSIDTNKSEITVSGGELINAVLLDSDKDTEGTFEHYKELAKKLIELFPKGSKSGGIAWRSNTTDIARRLQKFILAYGNNWSDAEIINATKRYVDHFNGDYTYMRVLKYFILKAERKENEDGSYSIEQISELATYLENADAEYEDNWLSSVI